MALLVFPLTHIAFFSLTFCFSVFVMVSQASPRNQCLTLALHNSYTRYCWGFPLFTKQTQLALHVSQYTIVSLQMRTESFLPSHRLSTRCILVPSDREHTARTALPGRADNLLLLKREVVLTCYKWLWGYFSATNKSFNLTVLMQSLFFFNWLFSFQFPAFITKTQIFGHSKLSLLWLL